MNMKEFIDLMMEVEVVEYRYPNSKQPGVNKYTCRYDAVVEKIKDLNNGDYIITDEGFDKDYVYFSIKEKETQGLINQVLFFIKVYKECCKHAQLEERDLEHLAVEDAILKEIEENIKFYPIDKYEWEEAGVCETEALEVYLGTLANEVLGIKNLYQSEFWKNL